MKVNMSLGWLGGTGAEVEGNRQRLTTDDFLGLTFVRPGDIGFVLIESPVSALDQHPN